MKSQNLPPLPFGNTKGFTLVEILVVIAIIAILSGLIITALNPVQLRKVARDANRKKDLGLISTALEQYYADNNAYPDTSDIECLGKILMSDADCDDTPGDGPTYLKAVPLGQSTDTDDNPINEYCFAPDANFQNYTLCAPLESDPGVDFRDPDLACPVGAPYGIGSQGPDFGRYCVENPF